MKIKSNYIFYSVTFLLFILLTIELTPLSDDLYYFTAPNTSPQLSQLLPNKAFWRPFDVLFGFLIGLCPSLFPFINRICLITGHIISVFVMQKILEHLNIKQYIINFCVLYAMFSSSVWATLVSPDGLNQVFSLLFGLIGLYDHFKKPQNLRYILFCIIAVLWKESGIIWICIIPFLQIMLNIKNLKELYLEKTIRYRVIKTLIIALFFCITYFSIRFLLAGNFRLGINGTRYSISVFSLSSVKNFINLFANALTGIDTVELFLDSLTSPLFLSTAILSSIFLGFCIYVFIGVLKNKVNTIAIFTTLISAIIISLPHIIIGKAGEMHTYPTTFSVCLIYAFLFNFVPSLNKKTFLLCTVCLYVSFLVSGIHKLNAIYDYSNRTKILTEQMIKNYTNPEDTLLIIYNNNKKGYSVFTQSALIGTNYGNSMKPYFKWQPLDITNKEAIDTKEAKILVEENLVLYDKVWLILDDQIKCIK